MAQEKGRTAPDPSGLSNKPIASPYNPTRALRGILQDLSGEDPLQGTGRDANGNLVTGPLEETEGSR
jgi:hypothetical protein